MRLLGGLLFIGLFLGALTYPEGQTTTTEEEEKERQEVVLELAEDDVTSPTETPVVRQPEEQGVQTDMKDPVSQVVQKDVSYPGLVFLHI